jgi:hypothetical protein
LFSAVQAFTTSTVTDVQEMADNRIPTEFVLRQNYPNPFNPSTTIPFEIASPAFVTLRVYDLLGREVETLVDGQLQAGVYSAQWLGHDGSGKPVPSGLYLVRMTAVDAAKSFSAARKMMLLK